MNYSMKLANIAYQIEGQPMFKVLDAVQRMEQRGEDVVHFEIGDPDFDTPRHIVEAACQSMTKGETHYTSSMGMHELRLAAAQATGASRGFTPGVEQVLVTPGANIIIYLAVKCLVNPGDEVILPDPGFPSYFSVLKLCQVKPVCVPLKEKNKFRMDPEDVLKSITKKTRLIIMNSPSNPCGAVMTPDEVDEIYSIARDKNVFLLSDEIYSRMMYEGCLFHSPAVNDRCLKNTIILNGFSKAFAMTGWRLGVAIGPAEVIEKMGLLVQTLCSCVPPFIQRAGIAAIQGDQTEIRKMMEIYKERRDVLVEGLNRLKGVTCLLNQGAFYVFPNIKKTGLTSEKFCDLMLEKARVALLPGTNFGAFGQGYIRLTYATGVDRIKEGLRRMEKILGAKKESA